MNQLAADGWWYAQSLQGPVASPLLNEFLRIVCLIELSCSCGTQTMIGFVPLNPCSLAHHLDLAVQGVLFNQNSHVYHWALGSVGASCSGRT